MRSVVGWRFWYLLGARLSSWYDRPPENSGLRISADGGEFVWDPNSTATDDGDVISPLGRLGPGRWLRVRKHGTERGLR